MNCLICRETYSEINKICICRDSFICDSCLELSNKNEITRCPICRKDLKIKKSINYFKYLFLLFGQILFQLFIYLVPLIILIYMYIEHDNNYNVLNENYHFIIFNIIFLIVFIEPINIYLFDKYFNIEYHFYQVVKCATALVLSAILSIGDLYEFKYYFILILLPFYYFPSLMGSIFVIFDFIKKFMDIIYLKTTVKNIKYEKIIFSNFNSITPV
jgi:hypothetical protein